MNASTEMRTDQLEEQRTAIVRQGMETIDMSLIERAEQAIAAAYPPQKETFEFVSEGACNGYTE